MGIGDHEKVWADVRTARSLGHRVPPALIERLQHARQPAPPPVPVR
jgi:hypothetical protein